MQVLIVKLHEGSKSIYQFPRIFYNQCHTYQPTSIKCKKEIIKVVKLKTKVFNENKQCES